MFGPDKLKRLLVMRNRIMCHDQTQINRSKHRQVQRNHRVSQREQQDFDHRQELHLIDHQVRG